MGSFSVALSVASLIFLAIVYIIFSLKDKINSFQLNLYEKLLLLTIFGTMIDIAGFISFKYNPTDSLINIIIAKVYIIYYFLWGLFFLIYVISISFDSSKLKSKYKYAKILASILSFILIILPIYIHNDNGKTYSYGPSVTLNYFLSFLFVIIMLYCLIKNIKHIIKKKYVPLLAYIFLGSIIITIQQFKPELTLILFFESIIMLIMYFTIENPDIKMLEQVEIARVQAERANKAKTEFLSSMSHEIRTPLNAIVGFSECMLTSNNLEEVKNFASDVVEASNNLLEIVNGILDISKIEANKMEITERDYNPREMCESLAKLCTSRIGEKPIEFTMHIAPDIPGVLKGDASKVKQIILNLLTNAAKYTDKGKIEFTINCINKLSTKSCILTISVSDTGRGIKTSDIPRLFTKFERIEEDKNSSIEGTGLGLAITKNLTEMMGGKLSVASTYQVGSTFRVKLPQKIISMEIPKEIVQEKTIDYNGYQNKKVLLVDDSKINLKVATQILKPYSFQIKTCESGFEALERLEQDSYDIIFMDIMMPKLNGIETLRRMKKQNDFTTPVVALTADAIEGKEEQYLSAGFNDYLSKPIERDKLDKIIHKFLEGEKE